MDHLPPVTNPYQPVVVPYLGRVYEGHTFTELLRADKIQLSSLQDDTIPIATKKSSAADLQALFFFGLLREVLNLDIIQDDFLATVDSDSIDHNDKSEEEEPVAIIKIITTRELRRYLATWKTTNDNLKQQQQQHNNTTTFHDRNEKVVSCLELAFDIWQSIPQFGEIVGHEVELSIQILACTLEHAVTSASDIPVERVYWRTQPSEFLTRRMCRDQGWCPAVVHQISRPCKLVWQYYCSLLGPPLNQHDWETCPCRPGDLACTLRPPNSGGGGGGSDEEYKPKHVCEDGECEDVSPLRMEEIEEEVREGGIPLLEFDTVTNELHVRKYRRGIQYTAISHVWSDGLGNPKANSMPQCQLHRLHNFMLNLIWTQNALMVEDQVWKTDHRTINLTPEPTTTTTLRPLLFWIDTICIPRSPPLRKQAISTMSSVYGRANRVLVLDNTLTSVSGSLTNPVETLSRISICPWLTRFWTLQEAVLAKTLWFQFQDQAYRSMSFTNPESNTVDALFDDEVKYYCEDFKFGWHNLAPYFDDARRVGFVWSALERRTSTFNLDQPVCIATLLDMSPAQIREIQDVDIVGDTTTSTNDTNNNNNNNDNDDDDEVTDDATTALRFQKLWLMYKSIPLGVLMVPGPKLSSLPLRWAPTILSHLAALPPPGITSSATPTPQGLLVTHHALMTTERLRENRGGVLAMGVVFVDDVSQVNPHLPGGDAGTTTTTAAAAAAAEAASSSSSEGDEGEANPKGKNYQRYTYLIRQNTKRGNLPWEGIDFREFDYLAVLPGVSGYGDGDGDKYRKEVLDSASASASASSSSSPPPPFDRCLGALVGVTGFVGDGEGDGDEIGGDGDGGGGSGKEMPRTEKGEGKETGVIIKATYLRAVSVLLQGSRWETVGQKEWEDWERREKEMVVSCRWTGARQRWLIS